MNWKYLKGSAKDFENAPDWCRQIVAIRNSDEICFEENLQGQQKQGDRYQWEYSEINTLLEAPKYPLIDYFTIQAQREPIMTWDGVGLPPVGTECEYSLNGGGNWWNCKIAYIVGTQGIVMLCDVFEGVQYVDFTTYEGKLKFRPFRSEADKNRSAAIEEMRKIVTNYNKTDVIHAIGQLYDAGYRWNGALTKND